MGQEPCRATIRGSFYGQVHSWLDRSLLGRRIAARFYAAKKRPGRTLADFSPPPSSADSGLRSPVARPDSSSSSGTCPFTIRRTARENARCNARSRYPKNCHSERILHICSAQFLHSQNCAFYALQNQKLLKVFSPAQDDKDNGTSGCALVSNTGSGTPFSDIIWSSSESSTALARRRCFDYE